jgi:hypothetical protein
VFDVEAPQRHPNLSEALELAGKNEIRVAISNPCFEFWLMLHFRDYRAWLSNDDARRIRRACDGRQDKGLLGAVYMPSRSLAAQRAKSIDVMHADNGTVFPEDNPSSGVYRLIAAVTVQRG